MDDCMVKEAVPMQTNCLSVLSLSFKLMELLTTPWKLFSDLMLGNEI